MRNLVTSLAMLAVVGPFAAGSAVADDAVYRVTVTNVTKAQVFAPILVATHGAGSPVFLPGTAASAELATLAETGDPGPLAGLVSTQPGVADVVTSGGMLPPGASVSLDVAADGNARKVSLAGMLVTTNDGFVGLNGVDGPRGNRTAVVHAPAYDAGSEVNDELCVNLPGPPCLPGSGNGHADEGGTVHVHRGIHGTGDLVAADSDWRNPVAVVRITRVDED